ncbi:phenylalanine--tRNA ligase subunit beta [Adlercreutzia agrestimuris]|uniref:phenylalanine--tRNA ligase subunit beta n=1 Tax=Adlercreutzia agrestimuris TaxID=2941324 RepID=UPI002041799F|nr:phenylalanine--tRNA ligase subunit beta [Adlercreutzia agrestimuris]
MKVSLNWLSEYVDVPADTKAFCDKLDLTGTGVEGVETLGESFDNIVVGETLSCEAHPDSDHLHVLSVNVGEDEPLQIVCGAPNACAGKKVVVAKIGAVLPGDFVIKKSKLRGVTSCGMCCSERELGLSNNHEGIWILADDTPVGTPIAQYLSNTDTVLDLEITPNRPDCLSMVGMAREVGAMYQHDYTSPLAAMADRLSEFEQGADVSDLVSVDVVDFDRCPRYTARVIDNVKIGPSPAWLAERVSAAGARSINNVVDVTNYIMFLFGQPLHAFDYDKLMEQDGRVRIVVRPAQEGEKFTTLDGENRVLTSDMTVIATPERAVALAGVMGGLETEVTEETTSVLLEAAAFNRAHTSRTSRNLGLISESSMRYERGVDDVPVEVISQAACALLAEVSGGTVRPGVVDVHDVLSAPVNLEFRIDRFCAMMGADIPEDFIRDILKRLGCEVSATDDPCVLAVVAPTFRPDLEREIDLYEEVLRLWGMDRVEATLPGGRGRFGVRSDVELGLAKINATLRASGLNETMTYSFAEPTELDRLRMPKDDLGQPVELLNPLNAEQSVMRQSIIPGLLRSVAYNQSRGVANIQLYESGKVFFAHEGKKKPKERMRVAGVLAGAMTENGWNVSPDQFDFFDGKGVIENLIRELALPKVRFKAVDADQAPHLQPGRAASVVSEGTVLGWVGELHPLAVRDFDITGPVVAFELDLDALIKAARPARDYRDVPVFPAVAIDLALVVDEGVTHEKILQCMNSAGGKLLEDVQLFDVYRDEERVGKNKKSLAYALTYRAPDRTLTSEEVDKAHERLVKKVCAAVGAEIRG